MDHAIRGATEQDKEILADLIRTAFRDVAERFGLTPANCPTHPSNCTANWIVRDLAKGKRYSLLEAEQRPVGCVAVFRSSDGVGEIGRLAVLPDARGVGFGGILLNHAMRVIGEMGLPRATLAIIADHTELRDWYIRRGFRPDGTRPFAGLPFTVEFLSKGLETGP